MKSEENALRAQALDIIALFGERLTPRINNPALSLSYRGEGLGEGEVVVLGIVLEVDHISTGADRAPDRSELELPYVFVPDFAHLFQHANEACTIFRPTPNVEPGTRSQLDQKSAKIIIRPYAPGMERYHQGGTPAALRVRAIA